MMNTNGTIKEISISDSTVHEMRTSYTVFEGVYTLNSLRLKDYINYFDPQYATELNNRVEFSPSIIGNFNWENKEVEIDAGSTYAVTIDVQWVSGTVDVDYVDTWQPYFNMTSMANDGVIPDNISNRTLEFKDLIKATYAADLSNLGELYLGLSSTGYVNPYYGTDVDKICASHGNDYVLVRLNEALPNSFIPAKIASKEGFLIYAQEIQMNQ